jgi:hypothetical protein
MTTLRKHKTTNKTRVLIWDTEYPTKEALAQIQKEWREYG